MRGKTRSIALHQVIKPAVWHYLNQDFIKAESLEAVSSLAVALGDIGRPKIEAQKH